MRNLDLTGVYAKLGRAKEHFDALEEEVTSWQNRKTNGINFSTTNGQPCTRRPFVWVRSPICKGGQRWILIVGDCLINLRAALDHLVCAVAVCESGLNPPPHERVLAFVVADTIGEFRKAAKKRLGALSDELREAFESIQPYNRVHPVYGHPLSILNELVNRDKHRMLKAAFFTPNILFHNYISPLKMMRWARSMRNVEIKDGTVVFAIRCAEPDPELHIQIRQVLTLVLEHGNSATSASSTRLHRTHRGVDR